MNCRMMIDLETLGNRPGSVIFAIGACRIINGELEPVESNFYCLIDPREAQERGLKLDADTVLWWLRQNEQARAELIRAGQEGAPLAGVVDSFISWHDAGPEPQEVLCKGASFDFPMLDAAFERVGKRVPWHFGRQGCYRTIARLAGNVPPVAPEVPHHALHDARAQAQQLIAILRHLGKVA